jgi:hypothetical protein
MVRRSLGDKVPFDGMLRRKFSATGLYLACFWDSYDWTDADAHNFNFCLGSTIGTVSQARGGSEW